MKTLVMTAAVLAMLGTANTIAGEVIEPTETIELFNGKDLSGWSFCVPGADPKQAFTAEDGVVKCAGKPRGYMRTDKAYKNYKLVIEWRFLKKGNSGILVHMEGQDKVWPRSIECQGMVGNQGDFWVIGGTEFKEHKGVKGRRVPKRGESNEKPIGDWQRYEVECFGDSIRPIVNGKLMNEATECSVTSGKICIQAEGAPWECRKITLEPAK